METRRGGAPAVDGADVVVVGGRCAGAATALLLARQGIDVVVLDRSRFPSDTMSTHGLSRGGVVLLARWGLLDEVMASGAPPVRQVSFHNPAGVTHRPIAPHAGVDFLVNPRRCILDAILLGAAERAGARVRTGVTVVDVVRDRDGRACGVIGHDADGGRVELGSRFVVGADGLRSRIAAAVAAPLVDCRPASGAAHYAYYADLDLTGNEYHTGPGGFAGVFPTHGGEANVWVCTSAGSTPPLRGDDGRREERFLELVTATSPQFAARLHRARRTSPVRGAVGMPNQVRQGVGDGWMLVGDAASHRDPISGHGMTDAFRDADHLARTLGAVLCRDVPATPALAWFERRRRALLRPVLDITTEMVAYPSVGELVALQKALAAALEAEADRFASMPPLRETVGGAASRRA